MVQIPFIIYFFFLLFNSFLPKVPSPLPLRNSPFSPLSPNCKALIFSSLSPTSNLKEKGGCGGGDVEEKLRWLCLFFYVSILQGLFCFVLWLWYVKLKGSCKDLKPRWPASPESWVWQRCNISERRKERGEEERAIGGRQEEEKKKISHQIKIYKIQRFEKSFPCGKHF